MTVRQLALDKLKADNDLMTVHVCDDMVAFEGKERRNLALNHARRMGVHCHTFTRDELISKVGKKAAKKKSKKKKK